MPQKNYRSLSDKVKSRFNPENRIFDSAFNQELASISYSDVLVYIRLAMKGVDVEYTRRSKEAGENAKSHLRGQLEDVSFEYQGSVMSNTHIRAHSDIDLLVLCDKFYSVDRKDISDIVDSAEARIKFSRLEIQRLEVESQIPFYTGNSLDDLRTVRLDSETILSRVYKRCDVTSSKCIHIHNQDLNRHVDVVVANYYDDILSIINNREINRGIQIYHKHTNSKDKPDYPFLSIYRINERGNQTNGRLKRMIRFLKNVRADSDLEIDVNSFDINGICYDIPVANYLDLPSLQLIAVIYRQLFSICTNSHHADRIMSVDGHEHIFRGKEEKLRNLKLLLAEISSIYEDFKQSGYA